MTRRIAVGIRSDLCYSAQVLDQLGIPAVPVESIADGIAQGIRVFLWNEPDVMSAELASKEGIAIITGHACLASSSARRRESAGQSYYFRLPHKPFSARSFYANLPVFTSPKNSLGVCYDRNDKEIPGSGIEISDIRNRLVVSLPWDICGYEQGIDWEHRPYYSRVANKHFVEVGPSLDTGEFRHLLLEILLYCFNRIGLPLVRVSPFYKNKRYFSFRIDADGFSQSSTEAGLRVAEKSGLRFTWFLDMGRWKNKNRWITRLLEHNQDVQFHCFRHMTYASQEVNDINIRKGLDEIRKSRITPNAIVSPMGYSYRGFSEAIREHGFAFSSEFGYAVDDLPSRPQNDEHYPLQIPVHPGCSGVFSQAGFSQEEQFTHFFDVAQERCNTDGICILYDHPIGGLETHETQYLDLFDQLTKSSYEYISMFDYYRAWIERKHNPRIACDHEWRIHIDEFQENGFRLEQVTNGPCKPVRWENATLPQVKSPGRTEDFCYPPEWIRDLADKNGLLNMKQRNFSKPEWYLHELFLALGRRTGYFQCRQSLARVGWLRAVRDRIRG